MGRSRRVCGCGGNGYAVLARGLVMGRQAPGKVWGNGDGETEKGFDRIFSGGRIRAFGPGNGWAGWRLLELRL